MTDREVLPVGPRNVGVFGAVTGTAISTGDNSPATVFNFHGGALELRSGPIVYGMPSLPHPYREPKEELAKLRPCLLDPGAAALGIVGSATGLLGMGGIGKTVLAIAFARDAAVQKAFPGGIVWLTFGRDVRVRTRQEEFIFALTGVNRPCRDTAEGRGVANYLAQKLSGPLLLVLDDVWDAGEARAAFSNLGPNIRILVTSRDRRVVDAFAAKPHLVGLLDRAAALDFLAKAAARDEERDGFVLPSECGEIARRCGGLMLALAAVVGLIRRRVYSWSEVLEALEAAKLDELPAEWRSDIEVANVGAVLKLSIDALSPGIRACYYDFAIFKEDTVIADAALVNIWESTMGPARLVKATARELVDRSLLQSIEDKGYAIHDLYRDFLRATQGNLPGAHADLVERYRAKSIGGWPHGPKDGYFFNALIWHLIESGQSDVADDLLFDPEWLQAHIAASGISETLSDYRMSGAGPEGAEVAAALRLSAVRLAESPGRFVQEICGRLERTDGNRIATLIESARKCLPVGWIIPVVDGYLDPAGQLVRLFTGHRGIVNDVAVSRDGRRMISGAEDKRLIMWDLDTGMMLKDLRGHLRGVNVVAFVKDSSQALSGSDDGTLILWNLETGERLCVLSGPDGSVDALAVLPDQWRAVSASSSGGLRLWDLIRHREIGKFDGFTARVTSLAVSPRGELLSGTVDGEVTLWDPLMRQRLKIYQGHLSPIRALAFVPDESAVMAVADDGTALAWHKDNETVLRLLDQLPVNGRAVALIPDEVTAVSGMNDGLLRSWDLIRGHDIDIIEAHGNVISALAPLPGGKRLVSGSHDETARLWDLTTMAAKHRLFSSSSSVTAIACTPDGETIISGAEDGTVRVWDIADCRVVDEFGNHNGSVGGVAVTTGGDYAVSGGHDGVLFVRDLNTGERPRRIETNCGLINKVVAIDGRRVLVAGGGGIVAVWDIEDETVREFEIRLPITVTGLAFHASTGRVLAGSGDGDVRMWDIVSGRVLSTYAGHRAAVPAIGFLPDGQHAVTGSTDGELRFWDLSDPFSSRLLASSQFRKDPARTDSMAPGIFDLSVVTADAYLALCTKDNRLSFWDPRRDRELCRFEDEHYISASVALPDGQRLAVGNIKGRIHIFDLSVLTMNRP